jgi:hypothetical protein
MRGGLLEHLHFRNLEVGQVAHAVITIDFNYEEGAKGSFTPVVRDYTVEGLRSGGVNTLSTCKVYRRASDGSASDELHLRQRRRRKHREERKGRNAL